MWQVVAVWRETKFFKPDDLSKQLKLVGDTYFQTVRNNPRRSQSQTEDMMPYEISRSFISMNAWNIPRFKLLDPVSRQHLPRFQVLQSPFRRTCNCQPFELRKVAIIEETAYEVR